MPEQRGPWAATGAGVDSRLVAAGWPVRTGFDPMTLRAALAEPDEFCVEVSDPAALRLAWRGAALVIGWARPQDWWCVEVDAVCEAVAGRRELLGMFSRLGRARAEAGVGLGETLDDVAALYAVLAERAAPAAVVRALAEAWVEVGFEPLRVGTCEDPLTGLTSAAHLRTRLAEVYREAEREGGSVHATHALVVVPTGLDGVARWDGLLRRLALGVCLRSVFSGGETLAGLGPSVVVGLVTRTPLLAAMVEALRRRLIEVATGTAVRGETEGGGARGAGDTVTGVPGDGEPPRVWVEGLPGGLSEAYAVLEDLAR
ncbi:MAG TPA: hypothetical protein VGO94_00010 [Mycobacteriales bacterium]|nr:hypothetical protein [Mycobacteriales bacterium]